MQYQVPQFIEVEDKIFGPFTLKQFIYLAGAAGISAVLLLSLPFVFGLILSLPFLGLGGALAFVKIDNKPFIEVLESAFFFFTGGKMYLWKKQGQGKKQGTPETNPATPSLQAPQQDAMQKIRALAWSLDVKDEQNIHGN